MIENETPAIFLPGPMPSALIGGGDGRLDLEPDTGLNKYGCAPKPREALPLGSCTASSPSKLGYRAAEELCEHLEAVGRDEGADAVRREVSAGLFQIRERLTNALGIDPSTQTGVVLTPSGTDAEMLASYLALGDRQSLRNIVVAPREVGSGTTLAAGMRHFDEQTPRGQRRVKGEALDRLAERVEVSTVFLRDESGAQRSRKEIEASIEDLVEDAVSKDQVLLLHVVAHSKTGAHAPSLRFVRKLVQERGAERVRVIVDAAQGRISRRGLNAALASGYMVLFTGSKFYGGPPFAGALLVPHALNPVEMGLDPVPAGGRDYFSVTELPPAWAGATCELSQEPNVGLLLRWQAALAEIEAYYAVEPQLRYEVLRLFESLVPEVFDGSRRVVLEPLTPPILDDNGVRLLESKRTVFAFRLTRRQEVESLDLHELRKVFAWANSDLSDLATSTDEATALEATFHLGQPVALVADGSLAVLRIALGAVLLRWLAEIEDPAERALRLRRHMERLRNKLEIIGEAYDRGRLK